MATGKQRESEQASQTDAQLKMRLLEKARAAAKKHSDLAGSPADEVYIGLRQRGADAIVAYAAAFPREATGMTYSKIGKKSSLLAKEISPEDHPPMPRMKNSRGEAFKILLSPEEKKASPFFRTVNGEISKLAEGIIHRFLTGTHPALSQMSAADGAKLQLELAKTMHKQFSSPEVITKGAIAAHDDKAAAEAEQSGKGIGDFVRLESDTPPTAPPPSAAPETPKKELRRAPDPDNDEFEKLGPHSGVGSKATERVKKDDEETHSDIPPGNGMAFLSDDTAPAAENGGEGEGD